jgi:hypothetical protein
MTTWKKAALGAAATLLLLAAIAVVALKLLVDPERLERVARDQARQAWSRELQVGAIRLELWPLPALRVRDVRLEHPSEPPIVAGTVTAELELLPLLVGQARYRTLHFKDATLVWEGTPWRVEEAVVEAGSDLKNVRVTGSLWRNRRHVALTAQFDDLSRLGVAGALTRGRIELDWGGAQLTAQGRVPLDGTMRHHALGVDMKGKTPRDVFAFLGSGHKPVAPFTARFETREHQGRILIEKLDVSLGRLRVKGDIDHAPGPRPVTKLRLVSERVDWTRTYLDMGGVAVPPPQPPQMFHDTPLAWWMLTGLVGKSGSIDATFGTLVLRNGVVLGNLRLKGAYADDRLDIASFSTDMLGGSAKGSIVLEGRKKAARLNFDGSGLLMERWMKERNSVVPFTGGPMKVTAQLASSGESLRDLVAGISGPFHVRMGHGVLASARAGEAEAKLTSAMGGKESNAIEFECAAFALPFRSGRARGERIIGARTSASVLVTSGFVDMRRQELDLRGRLKARSGVSLATIAGDVKITGSVRQPRMSLDETATPKAIARGAAAIATLGLSAVGTAIADSEDARRNDPCEVVFRK